MKMWMTMAVIAAVNIVLGCSVCGWQLESEWECMKHVYSRVFPLIAVYELCILLLAWSNIRQVRSSVR